MSELIRFIAARLRRFVGERRRFPRFKAQREARMLFNISPVGAASKTEGAPEHLLTLAGHTRDFSETGLAIIVSSLRVAGHELDVVGRAVRITLDLATGPVHMHAMVVRCEPLGERGAPKGYLIAVRITEMNDREWVRLVRYMHTLQ